MIEENNSELEISRNENSIDEIKNEDEKDNNITTIQNENVSEEKITNVNDFSFPDFEFSEFGEDLKIQNEGSKPLEDKIINDDGNNINQKDSLESDPNILTINENNSLNKSETTVRNWNDHLINPLIRKGKFTKDEIIKLIKALVRYGYNNNLTYSQLESQVLKKQMRSNNTIWTKLGESLPNRPIKSISDFLHRILSPNNYKGVWKEEEIRSLVNMYKLHGPKWKLIGDALKRHPENVRDKLKNILKIKEPMYKVNISKKWNLSNTLKLLKYINNQSQLPLLKWNFKYSKMFKNGDLDGDKFLDEGEEKLLIDVRLKKKCDVDLINVNYFSLFDFFRASKIFL